MASQAEQIIEACESEWDAWKSDCSGFVKAVADRVGVNLRGQANQIVDLLAASASWDDLGQDPRTASLRANHGEFVNGGLKDRPHGHVVIVVKSAQLKYPVAYWGRFGLVGRKHTTINWSWSRPDLAKVRYFAATP